MQERLTARFQGELTAAELAELETHVAGCVDCAAEAAGFAELWRELGETGEPVPSDRMRARLDTLLAAERAAGRERAAAEPLGFPGRMQERREPARGGGGLFARRYLGLAAMLLVGLGLGYLLFGRSGDDVAILRREVGDLHTMVALSLLEKGSVSERLQGVAYSREVAVNRDFSVARGQSVPGGGSGPGAPAARNEPVVAALFTRLLEDPNVNVRLAALEALRPLAAHDDRRGEFVAAVARQQSPLVALSLIDLLLESDGAAARHDLEQLLANHQLDPVVRGYLRDRLGRST
ncbi:MAG: zf-HC2 domain-containing protein [Thermoanaerobaculia bacterium]